MTASPAIWPGLHPGTGRDDHLHVWEVYLVPGSKATIRACEICGEPHPNDRKAVGLS